MQHSFDGKKPTLYATMCLVLLFALSCGENNEPSGDDVEWSPSGEVVCSPGTVWNQQKGYCVFGDMKCPQGTVWNQERGYCVLGDENCPQGEVWDEEEDRCVLPDPDGDNAGDPKCFQGMEWDDDLEKCVPECQAQCDDKQCGDDGCGDSCGTCTGGKQCLKGHCQCVPHYQPGCMEDEDKIVFWFDSCGNKEEQITVCDSDEVYCCFDGLEECATNLCECHCTCTDCSLSADSRSCSEKGCEDVCRDVCPIAGCGSGVSYSGTCHMELWSERPED